MNPSPLISFRSLLAAIRSQVGIGWLVGLLLFGWIVVQVGPQLAWERVALLRWPEFLLASLLVVVQIGFAARRWQLVAATLNVEVAPQRAFTAYFISTALNLTLPGGVMGDLWRAHDHAQALPRPTLRRAWYAALIDRGLGLLITVAIASLAAWTLPLVIATPTADALAHWVGGGLAGLSLALVMLPGLARRLHCRRHAPRRWRLIVHTIRELGHAIRRLRNRAGEALGLSLALVVGCMMQWSFCAASISIEVPSAVLAKAWLIYPIILAAMSVPIGPGGLGVRELGAAVALPLIDIAPEQAVAIAAVYGVSTVVGVILAGVFALAFAGRERLRPAPQLKVLDPWWGHAWLAAVVIHILIALPKAIANLDRLTALWRPSEKSVGLALRAWMHRPVDDFWRLSFEVVAVLSGLAAAQRWQGSPLLVRWLQRLGTVTLIVAWLYAINMLIGAFLMNQEPLFYDEWFLVAHSLVLIGDLWQPWLMAGLFIAILSMVASMALIAQMVKVFTQHVGACGRLSVIWLTAAWLMIAVQIVEWPGFEQPMQVRSALFGLAANLQKSLQTWQAMESKFANHEAKVPAKLVRTPNIAFYVIESYGKIAFDEPLLHQRVGHVLSRHQNDLAAQGWHMVSGYSRAPVSGGRSWIADASVFVGENIRYEAEYRHVIAQRARIPHLVRLLDENGYTTLRFAPADRQRPGIVSRNDWGFDSMLTWDELNYAGPKIGWGLVPDQWSLGYLNTHVAAHLKSPYFVFFHMVSAHAPWGEMPRIMPNWQGVLRLKGDQDHDDMPFAEVARKAAWRFNRADVTRYAYAGEATENRLLRYGKAILYDIEILGRHLLSDEKADFVVIMGDHQPPLLSAKTEDFNVPVHIATRNPDLVAAFLQRGFIPGLIPPAQAHDFSHADLLPTLVETLH